MKQQIICIILYGGCMLTEQKIVVRTLIDEVWSGGKLAALDQLTTDKLRHHCPLQPTGIQGQAAYKQWISHLRSAFPDLKLTALTYLVAEGDQVIGRWSMTGTHVGNLSIIRATSNPINLEVMAAFRFNDERIVESTLSYDLFTLVRQLGLVPELPGINPVLPLGVPA
jgi:steroid delta-isomerase-like uncharacterized protein